LKSRCRRGRCPWTREREEGRGERENVVVVVVVVDVVVIANAAVAVSAVVVVVDEVVVAAMVVEFWKERVSLFKAHSSHSPVPFPSPPYPVTVDQDSPVVSSESDPPSIAAHKSCGMVSPFRLLLRNRRMASSDLASGSSTQILSIVKINAALDESRKFNNEIYGSSEETDINGSCLPFYAI
jgi:hypothetical protein